MIVISWPIGELGLDRTSKSVADLTDCESSTFGWGAPSALHRGRKGVRSDGVTLGDVLLHTSDVAVPVEAVRKVCREFHALKAALGITVYGDLHATLPQLCRR